MKKTILTAVVVLLVGGALYFGRDLIKSGTQPPPPSRIAHEPMSVPSGQPTRYPVPALSEASGATLLPLPPVDESDTSLEEGLIKLLGKDRIESVLNLKDLIRRIVVTVNNGTEEKLPAQELSPIKPLEGAFVASGGTKVPSIDPKNYGRYSAYVAFAQALDPEPFVALYIRFYPLFQAAYRDLGSEGYFNDRVVEVIDHILETPEVPGPVKLVSSSVYFKYADPGVESLSAIQKSLIRMGPDNAVLIKSKLKQLRARLVHLGE